MSEVTSDARASGEGDRAGGPHGGRRASAAGGAVRAVGLALLGSVALASSLAGQGRLEQYDYENLRLRGIGADVGIVAPNDLDDTIALGVRIDLGFLGPNVRILPRGAFWSSDLSGEEVTRLETRVEDLVEEQNPGQPRPTVDLGAVERSAAIVGSDIHWMPIVQGGVRPYLGVGAELYFLEGSGPAVEGTFIEDALDLITAGASGVVGVEVDVGETLTVYGEGRGSLVADLSGLGLSVGVAYLVP